MGLSKCRLNPHPEGVQLLVLLHQLLFQLHNLRHGLILHVEQLVRHLATEKSQMAIKGFISEKLISEISSKNKKIINIITLY